MSMTPEQIEAVLADHTSSLAMLDSIMKANKLGVKVTLAFRCAHSSLLFPADYCKQWGVKYGVGLGPRPVSEVLDSIYSVSPPDIQRQKIQSIDQIMHPVQHSMAEVHLVTVTEDELAAAAAIPMAADAGMKKRLPIIIERQLKNPQSKLPAIYAAWQMKGGK